MNFKTGILLTAIIASSFSAAAQRERPAADTAIGGTTIEIIQNYKPEVKQAPKPEYTPALPPIDTTTPSYRYVVPEQTLYYTYSATPLRPLAFNTDSAISLPYQNYLKVGAGNYSTLNLDAGISSLNGENYNTTFQAHHLSQNGNIKNQKVSLTGINANGTLYKNDLTLNGNLDVQHNRYHLYGYDHVLYNYEASAIRQAFTSINIGAGVNNNRALLTDLYYAPSVKAILYSDNNDASENTFEIKLPFTYYLDSSVQLYASANAAITSFNNKLGTQSNNIFSITPGILFSRNSIEGHAKLSLAWGQSGNQYLLPDAEVKFMLPGTQFMLFAGYESQLEQNRYQQLSTINPYMLNTYTALQTQTSELYGGLKTNIGNNISFSGKVGWWQYADLPIFINDTLGDKKQFNVIYDNKVNAISIEGSVRYQAADVFSIGFTGEWINFYSKTFEQVWHRPGIRFTGDATIRPISKLSITAYSTFIDQNFALDVNNRSFKLNALLDIGAGAEYEIIDRLNVFIQVNNLLNNTYQRWYGYEVYGTNVFGGVRLKF